MCKKINNIFKTLVLIVLISGISYQIYHTALLLINEDAECCPCMQFKMFYITLDKSACCECPNGFHLTFTFIDFLIETIYDISSVFLSILFLSAFCYFFYIIASLSIRNISSFLIIGTIIISLVYNYQNQFDGGYIRLIGTNTMYNLCEMKCNMFDSKKRQYTCSARCLNKYMTNDYLEVLENVRKMNTKINENYHETVEKATTETNRFLKNVNKNYHETVEKATTETNTFFENVNNKFTNIFTFGKNLIFNYSINYIYYPLSVVYDYVYDTYSTTNSYITNILNSLL